MFQSSMLQLSDNWAGSPQLKTKAKLRMKRSLSMQETSVSCPQTYICKHWHWFPLQNVCFFHAQAIIWSSRGFLERHLHRGRRREALKDAPWGRRKECCHLEVRFCNIVLWWKLILITISGMCFTFILTAKICVHQGYLHIHPLVCRAGWKCKAHDFARPIHPSLPL